MCLRRASGAALFLSVLFLQTGCVFTGDAALPAEAPGMDAHASRPKELPADRTAELCQAAAEELEKQGLNSDAVVQYEKARRLDPKRGPVVARRLAVLYDRLGDDAHALADYKEALTAAPHDADLLNDFGYYHYQRGELDEAEKCFRQALEVNHSHLRAAVNLGLTLGKQGKADASLEAFRQVLPASEAYCNVGVLLAQQGKAADARHSLEEALHLEPGMKQARLVLDHLDDIAAAAPAAGRPAVAAVAPPPVRQAAAPVRAAGGGASGNELFRSHRRRFGSSPLFPPRRRTDWRPLRSCCRRSSRRPPWSRRRPRCSERLPPTPPRLRRYFGRPLLLRSRRRRRSRCPLPRSSRCRRILSRSSSCRCLRCPRRRNRRPRHRPWRPTRRRRRRPSRASSRSRIDRDLTLTAEKVCFS